MLATICLNFSRLLLFCAAKSIRREPLSFVMLLVLSLYMCVTSTGSSEMRFNTTNQSVNSISLRAITGARFEVLRGYLSQPLRLERICAWLQSAIQTLYWSVTTVVRGYWAGIHQMLMNMSPSSDPNPTVAQQAKAGATRFGSKPATGTTGTNRVVWIGLS